jgi:Bacterial antitoxin of type II TA system, VapB
VVADWGIQGSINGLVIAPEYGHSTGLNDNSTATNFMNGSGSSGNVRVTSSQCTSLRYDHIDADGPGGNPAPLLAGGAANASVDGTERTSASGSGRTTTAVPTASAVGEESGGGLLLGTDGSEKRCDFKLLSSVNIGLSRLEFREGGSKKWRLAGITFSKRRTARVSLRMYAYTACMHTIRMTMNIDKALLEEVVEAHPGATKTALVEEGLRALLAREASERLAKLGGKAPRARAPKRSAWKKS